MLNTSHELQPLTPFETLLKEAECLFDFSQIQQALDKMALSITHTLAGTCPLVLCVMTGGLMTTSYLLTRLNFLLIVDYIHATRYGKALTGGVLQWLVRPHYALADRTVLIIDDIMDGGLTLAAIVDHCQRAGARAVYTAVLINKRRAREAGVTIEPDFMGLEVDNRYLFGFGLDYEGYWRNLPAIYAVDIAQLSGEN